MARKVIWVGHPCSMAFHDGPHNFEQWSSDEDVTSAGNSLSCNFHTPSHQRENVCALDRFYVHHLVPVFSGTRLELMTRRSRVCYPDH
ncbi:hypothetical protein TNCV_3760441 [Trichonephila clavipes]|nr:hypothetical protein TNCV_3760441 [Trichonephila clavipes]